MARRRHDESTAAEDRATGARAVLCMALRIGLTAEQVERTRAATLDGYRTEGLTAEARAAHERLVDATIAAHVNGTGGCPWCSRGEPDASAVVFLDDVRGVGA